MTTHPLQRDTSSAQAAPANGAARRPMPGPGAGRGARSAPDLAVQLMVAGGLLAGLWVAISPWFLTLQAAGDNAAVSDLIIGLAVAAVAGLTAASGRSAVGLQAASALAGVWLIISPFILAVKFSVANPMYWSNIWAGGLIVALALGALTASKMRAAR